MLLKLLSITVLVLSLCVCMSLPLAFSSVSVIRSKLGWGFCEKNDNFGDMYFIYSREVYSFLMWSS